MATTNNNTDFISEILAGIDRVKEQKIRVKMILATKISRRLKALGLSQKDFAKKIGKTESEVSAILSGDRNFTCDTLIEIEEAIGVSLLDKTLLNTWSVRQECEVKCRPINPRNYTGGNATVTNAPIDDRRKIC